MIKYNAPFELEEILLKHPAVADCAVVGAPDADGFEVPKAYVVLRPAAPGDADDLMTFVAERVARLCPQSLMPTPVLGQQPELLGSPAERRRL